MNLITVIVVAGIVFGACFLVDKAFTRAFRSKQQHKSGLAVRANKNYGIFGLALSVLGVLAIITGIFSSFSLPICGVIVLLIGIAMGIHYLSFGIFYDGESFLISSFGKKSVTHFYRDILGQKLYVVTGGSVIVELHMQNGSIVSLQTTMDGVYLFLDTAFAAWCMAAGRDAQSCDFHDPSNCLWFPTVEEN